MIKVLPSTNPVQEDKLVDFAKSLMELNVEYLHCDVMDGQFVENTCLSIEIIESVRNNTNILLDVHLMVADNKKYVKRLLKLNPNIITVHYESVKSIKKLAKLGKLIKSKDILFGVAIKPETPVEVLTDILSMIDLVLVMSVEPGKSGQKFMPIAIEKIKKLKQLTMSFGYNTLIEVDGGINETTFSDVVSAGATLLVIGSAFYNSKDRAKLLHTISSHYLLKKENSTKKG